MAGGRRGAWAHISLALTLTLTLTLTVTLTLTLAGVPRPNGAPPADVLSGLLHDQGLRHE